MRVGARRPEASICRWFGRALRRRLLRAAPPPPLAARAVGPLAAFCLLVQGTPAPAATHPFGKPGEPIKLVVGFNPYFAPAWTLAVVHHKGLWKKRLPEGSQVELNVGLRGPALADYLRNGEVHFAYFGDAAVALAAAKPDIRLIAVTMMSQDLCVLLVRADAPRFASAREGARWLDGKRIATTPGTCQGRITQLVLDRERVKPARLLDLGRELLELAFREGRIDAAGVPEPGASDLVLRGVARRLASSRIYGQWDASFIATSAALLRARPDVISGWLAAELEAQRFLADPRNADEAVRMLATYARHVSAQAVRAALYGAYPESQGGAAERAVFPFVFSGEARETVRKIHAYAQRLGLAPAGELAPEVVDGRWAERALAAAGFKSPLGRLHALAPVGVGS
ncbi:MAG TPA: ABC transporter substrate-binding protein [Burkholderiales bacterium]|nr:ABC transporter substrate-binding protein [Burkholderiales bacterium]